MIVPLLSEISLKLACGSRPIDTVILAEEDGCYSMQVRHPLYDFYELLFMVYPDGRLLVFRSGDLDAPIFEGHDFTSDDVLAGLAQLMVW